MISNMMQGHQKGKRKAEADAGTIDSDSDSDSSSSSNDDLQALAEAKVKADKALEEAKVLKAAKATAKAKKKEKVKKEAEAAAVEGAAKKAKKAKAVVREQAKADAGSAAQNDKGSGEDDNSDLEDILELLAPVATPGENGHGFVLVEPWRLEFGGKRCHELPAELQGDTKMIGELATAGITFAKRNWRAIIGEGNAAEVKHRCRLADVADGALFSTDDDVWVVLGATTGTTNCSVCAASFPPSSPVLVSGAVCCDGQPLTRTHLRAMLIPLPPPISALPQTPLPPAGLAGGRSLKMLRFVLRSSQELKISGLLSLLGPMNSSSSTHGHTR